MSVAHHGPERDPEQEQATREVMQRFMAQVEGRAKRQYQHGRLNADDEGALALAVAADHKHQRIIIDLGKSVDWIGLTAKDAQGLIEMLMQKVRELGQPVTIAI